MFTCKACLRRALVALIDHTASQASSSNAAALSFTSVNAAKAPRSRGFATAATSRVVADYHRNYQDSYKDEDVAARKVTRSKDWAAQKQLQYMDDPFHINNHVRTLLEKDKYEEATLIARKASKNYKVTVGFNHLIDYQLRKGRIHPAIKLYNEMKKRAQEPNAQTFTIIFRGLAKSPHSALAVAQSVKLFHNMIATGRIQPNIVHLNAVLQVCARAEDLESMFSILEHTSPGLRTPNNLTYTTILNALRATADKKPSGRELTEDEAAKNMALAVQRGKRIWEEVMSQWRSGSLVIDEELVCAMGRLLLLGDYDDAVDVESLVDSTILGENDSSEAITEAIKAGGEHDPSEGQDMKDGALARTKRHKSKGPRFPSIVYPTPGRNSLSMVLTALAKTRRTTRALRYWGIFTQNYNVQPDMDNWLQLLRVYNRGKNSANTVAYLENMPPELMTIFHFRVAMNTCLRDNFNRSAFKHATEIMDMMLQRTTLRDPLTMHIYLLAAYANRSVSRDGEARESRQEKLAWGKQVATALGRLARPTKSLIQQWGASPPARLTDQEKKQRNRFRTEVVELCRKLIAAYDRLAYEQLASRDELSPLEGPRNAANRLVVAATDEARQAAGRGYGTSGPDEEAEAMEDEYDEVESQKPRPWRRR
ncbi:hypothetical protein F4780DRAFT_775399 [Xylariomycetidae sp. FL0641]|nr:hypothetical protein F4780DRAFT_775399 [Xylariomycetidae sp. FL0641]